MFGRSRSDSRANRTTVGAGSVHRGRQPGHRRFLKQGPQLNFNTQVFADARNYLSGIFSLGLATQDGLAGQLATATLERLPEDYLETYRERVLKITAADVLDATQKYFDSANAQIVIVGDRAQVEEQANLFGKPEVYDAQGNRI